MRRDSGYFMAYGREKRRRGVIMNREEITRHNIRGCGYSPGRSIKGKGTQVLSRPRCVSTGWSLDSKDPDSVREDKQKLRKDIGNEGQDKVFVKELRIATSDGGKFFNFEEHHPISLQKFPISKLLDNDFEDILYISVYTIPEVKAYVKMSRVKSTIESQQDMARVLIWEAEGKDITGEFLESSYDEMDNQIEFTSSRSDKDTWEYNGDYTLYHGPSICLDDTEVERIDGKMDTYNEAAVDDFWNFTMADEDPFQWVDPDGLVSVYARKGKDWYVTSGVEQEQIFLTYRDDDGELVDDEEFWYFADVASDELVNKVEACVHGLKTDVEIKSLINNELHYGNWSWKESYEYNKDIFNLKILKKIFGEDELQEAGWAIMEYVDWATKEPYDVMVSKAYEKYLLDNMKDECLFGKYKHLRKLRKIVESEGKTLVYSKIAEFTDEMQWAIKYKDEEYHFSLSQLFEINPRKFYEVVSANIAKRKIEDADHDVFVRKATKVFVGFHDSVESGNCKSGTQSFCNRFGIDVQKVGGIRGDALLGMDYSSFTRRAVIQAIQVRG